MAATGARWLACLVMAMDDMMQHRREGIEGEVTHSKAVGKGDLFGDMNVMIMLWAKIMRI